MDAMLCIVRHDGSGGEAECLMQAGTKANDAIEALKNKPPTTASGEAGDTVRAFQETVGACVALMDKFVSEDGVDVGRNRSSEGCDEAKLRSELQDTDANLRTSLVECGKTAKGFSEFMSENRNKPTLALIAEASTQPDLPESVGNCLENVAKAADDFKDIVRGFTLALTSTLQFCALVPEPVVCGAFAVLQLLMLIFQSGSGGGEGDGTGTGEGRDSGQASQRGAGERTPGTPNGDSDRTAGLNFVAGDGCTLKQVADDLLCGENFTAKNFFGGAGFLLPESLDDNVKEPIQQALADARNDLGRYFGDAKFIVLHENQFQYCVNKMPGLDYVFAESREQQTDRGSVGDILTAVYLSPDPNNPGVYRIEFDHSGAGC